jgi:hypothetical protein
MACPKPGLLSLIQSRSSRFSLMELCSQQCWSESAPKLQQPQLPIALRAGSKYKACVPIAYCARNSRLLRASSFASLSALTLTLQLALLTVLTHSAWARASNNLVINGNLTQGSGSAPAGWRHDGWLPDGSTFSWQLAGGNCGLSIKRQMTATGSSIWT